MDGAFETTASSPSELAVVDRLRLWQRPAPLAVAGLVLLCVGGLAVWTVTRPGSPPVVRLTVAPDGGVPPAVEINSPSIAISPSGEQLAYLTGVAGLGAGELHVRPLATWNSETLVADGTLTNPFFSPDSQSVGFSDRSTNPPVLKRVAVRGGPASTICDLPGVLRGASWGADDTIIFGTFDGGLWQVAAGGGEPRQLTTPDAAKMEVDHNWPEILPGGDVVLFSINTGSMEASQIAVLSLDTLEYEVVLCRWDLPAVFPHRAPPLWRAGKPLGRGV